MRLAWVPLPAPGTPSSTIGGSDLPGAGADWGVISKARRIQLCPVRPAPEDAGRARGEALVMAHDQLRLDLLHRVHGHPDHDQQRGAAEVERHPQAVEEPR